MDDITLLQIMQDLTRIDDVTWGMYAFSRDILKDKISQEAKRDMIRQAIDCGCKKADEVMERYGTDRPGEIARQLHIKVELSKSGQMADCMLLALFTPPDRIEIMEESVKKAAACTEMTEFASKEQIQSLILGHEIFHYLEERDPNLYTKSEKIALWKLLGYTYYSSVRALSEIAAMYFTKKLNAFPYSPFILDVVLSYHYNPNETKKLFDFLFDN